MAIIREYNDEEISLSHSFDTNPIDEWFEYHIHDCYELFCLVKGKVGYLVEGHIYKLKPSAILLMRSSEAHKLIVNKSDEYERYVLNFKPELFSCISSLLRPFTERALGTKNLYLPSDLGSSSVSVFEKIFKEIDFLSSPRDVVISNVGALLSSISVAFSSLAYSYNQAHRDLDYGIISFINENLTSDLSLKTISAAVHLSPSQINRVFKGISGTSVHDYILSKRLILFHEKLSSGKTALLASQECGFRDYSSFYRLYKKRFGISPTNKAKKHT